MNFIIQQASMLNAIQKELNRLDDNKKRHQYLKSVYHFHSFNENRLCEKCGLSQKEYIILLSDSNKNDIPCCL